MFHLPTLVLFLTTAAALLFTPGPVIMYTVARSLHQGRQAGFVSTLAVGLGDFCHVLAAALGLSALLASSAFVFTFVKYVGAAYLIYLGIGALLSRSEIHSIKNEMPTTMNRVFYQGLLVSIFNPKTALFFIAFLPQFVSPDSHSVALQIIFLGCLFVMMGICSNIVYVVVASNFRQLFQKNLKFLQAQRYLTGGVYITLGVTTALAGSGETD